MVTVFSPLWSVMVTIPSSNAVRTPLNSLPMPSSGRIILTMISAPMNCSKCSGRISSRSIPGELTSRIYSPAMGSASSSGASNARDIFSQSLISTPPSLSMNTRKNHCEPSLRYRTSQILSPKSSAIGAAISSTTDTVFFPLLFAKESLLRRRSLCLLRDSSFPQKAGAFRRPRFIG